MTNKVSKEQNEVAAEANTTPMGRRRALALLGLAAATASVAPTLLG